MAKYWNTVYYSQIDAESLKYKARQSILEAEKKGRELHPIIIEGRIIAKSWWGNAWCENIESYADYESRLDRGKRYVRSGAVIDLVIEKGKVKAKVQGSRKRPYNVEINISPLKEKECEKIIELCGSQITSLEKLANGDFPESLKELFMGEGGLFPTPREISFSCSCPDWAIMCKHVSAVLYGIGSRLDDNPFLFFELRGIDADKLIDIAIKDHLEAMISHSDLPTTDRTMDDDVLDSLFGLND